MKTIELTEEQVKWILSIIDISNAENNEILAKGIHDISEAQRIVEFDKLLKDLSSRLNPTPSISNDISDIF